MTTKEAIEITERLTLDWDDSKEYRAFVLEALRGWEAVEKLCERPVVWFDKTGQGFRCNHREYFSTTPAQSAIATTEKVRGK